MPKCAICVKHGRHVEFNTELELVKHREAEHGESPVRQPVEPVPPGAAPASGYAGGADPEAAAQHAHADAAWRSWVERSLAEILGAVSALETELQARVTRFDGLAERLEAQLDAGAATVEGDQVATLEGTLQGQHQRIDALASNVQKLADQVERAGASQKGLNDHFTSEVASVRDALGRLSARPETSLMALAARLSALEQQALGNRVRTLEEKAGIVAAKPEELRGAAGPGS